MSKYRQRRQQLRRFIRKSQADALLVTNFTNVTYLTGFTGDDSYLLVMRHGEVLISDPRYTTQLAEECPDLEVDIRQPGMPMLDSLVNAVGSAKPANLGVEAGSMTLGLYQQIVARLPKTQIVPTSGLVEELRIIKDKEEIGEIREAIGFAERAFAVIRAQLRPDLTEKQVADDLEHHIRQFGGRGCSFPPIIAAGPRAALPHARATEARLGDSDFVLIDWGARGRLYLSDLTRVLVTGRIPPKLERIYGVVLTAQRRAIAAIRAGASMHEVDAAARNYIAKADYGKFFGHGLGHGIGLEIHESPRLGVNQHHPLRAGMVVTVEPGIYLPGWGGVRIEDDVLVTRTGHEVLSSVPKEFEDCILA
jgi:Xaa-Pro aminopeptidase